MVAMFGLIILAPFADPGDGDGHAIVHELAAGALGQGIGGHDSRGSFGPAVLGQVGQGRRQRRSILATGRLADHPGGIWQHRSPATPASSASLAQVCAAATRPASPVPGVGVAGIGQQVAHLTEETLLGQGHRRGTERVQGEHPATLEPSAQRMTTSLCAPVA